MDVVALRIQTRVFKTVPSRRKNIARGMSGVGGYVQMMAEFGGRIARGHLGSHVILPRSLLVAREVNYG